MDFVLTDEQRMIVKTVRDFAQKELAPTTAFYDESNKFPWENLKKMAELNLTGIRIPQEYGGSGLGYFTEVLVLEELAKVDFGQASILVPPCLVMSALLKHGNEKQKEKYLPAMAKGDLAAICLTEPQAGSDAAAIETAARLEGDHYVLNGNKTLISLGEVAKFYMIMTKTDKGKGIKGISTFMVEKGTPGFTFGKREKKLGSSPLVTCNLYLDNSPVPRENLLGSEGDGFRVAMEAIDVDRLCVSALSLGLAQSAFEAAVGYAKERVQFGRPIAGFEAIQFKIADMATQIEAARRLIYYAAQRDEKGLPAAKECNMAKVFTSDMVMKVAIETVQVFGGYGYLKEYTVERYLREAKLPQIYAGTNEIIRLVIARHVFGKP